MSIYNDNVGAELPAKNPIVHSRTKHNDIWFHFVRDALATDTFSAKHLESKYMTADILTKLLPKEKHYFYINSTGIE